jgi:uncharacterized protein
MVSSPGQDVTRQIPVGEKLFKFPPSGNDAPHLIGSRCLDCGETVFPGKTRCPNCCGDKVEEVLIGPRGSLHSFTIIYQAGPVGYKGPLPYGVVKVAMPEGLRITGYCTENNPAKLVPGMEMELLIERLFDDEKGNEIIGFKFRPVN